VSFYPGVLLKDPGVLLKDPGIFLKDPGILLKDPPGDLCRSVARPLQLQCVVASAKLFASAHSDKNHKRLAGVL